MAWTPIKLRKGGEISFVGESEGGGGGSQPLNSPLDIAGCVLWLDASDASTINGGAPADGDRVTEWRDKSPSGFDATQDDTPAVPEEDTVQVVGATGGTFDLTVTDPEPLGTDPIIFSASAATVQAALIAAGIGATVTGVDAPSGLTVTLAPPNNGLNADNHLDGDATSVDVVVTQEYVADTSGAPVFVADAQNGRSAIRFDGVEQWMDLATALGILRDTAGVTFAVTGPAAYLADTTPTVGGWGPLHVSSAGDATQPRFNINDTLAICDPTDSGTAWDSESVKIAPGDIGWLAFLTACDWGNGGGPFVQVQASRGLNDFSPGGTMARSSDTDSAVVRVAQYDGHGFYGGEEGDIGEMLVYDRMLNGYERRQLLEYLAARWATS